MPASGPAGGTLTGATGTVALPIPAPIQRQMPRYKIRATEKPLNLRLGASRFWDFQLAADGARRAFLDFAVSWNRRDFAVSRVFPNRMISPFTREQAPVAAKMALQVEPLHEAAS
jgi:hypothetical protein